MAMNEKAKQWVAELRSGKYDQGRNALRNASNQFCCLGVLCNISYPKGWKDDTDEFGHYFFEFFESDGEPNIYSDDQMPPDALVLEVGLDYKDAIDLANMNDNGYEFEEIADKIELLLGF